jgi:bacterioferritin-associated ferredoxin
MFACICRAVTSDEVTVAIDNGAATLAAVARATGACKSCGTCRDRIRSMLSEQGAAPRPRVIVPAALSRARVGWCVVTNGPSSS